MIICNSRYVSCSYTRVYARNSESYGQCENSSSLSSLSLSLFLSFSNAVEIYEDTYMYVFPENHIVITGFAYRNFLMRITENRMTGIFSSALIRK